MLYNQLENVTEEQVRESVKKYFRENGIGNIDLAAEDSEDIITSIVCDVITELAAEGKENFKKIQRQGIEAARAKGKTLGRPKKQLPPGFEKIYKAYQAGNITARECAKVLEVPLSTFSYMVKKYRNENT